MMSTKHLQDMLAVSVNHVDNRFKIAHATTDAVTDTACMAVLDTKTYTAITMNLTPSDDPVYPSRFCVELVLVEGTGSRRVLYEDEIYEPLG